eukprot:m.156877 g.156877  ORF g.156877 m.156877 type:complete len:187 (+) comp31031_c0_seq2:315-875(+)
MVTRCLRTPNTIFQHGVSGSRFFDSKMSAPLNTGTTSNHAHSMVDGPVDAVDLDKTEANRALVKSFVDTVLIDRHPASLDKIEEFVDEHFTEHNPRLSDGVGVLRETLAAKFTNDTDEKYVVQYNHTHRILAEGNFVLCVNEGEFEGVHSSFYDLFRVANGKIVEHWDTLEHVPPKSEWKNNNGKF